MGHDGTTHSDSTTELIITTAELKSYYATMGRQNASAADAVRILDVILDRDAEEDLTIAEIESSLLALRSLIDINTKEIFRLNLLLAKLIFILFEQGIEIKDKELLNEMKQYLKK